MLWLLCVSDCARHAREIVVGECTRRPAWMHHPNCWGHEFATEVSRSHATGANSGRSAVILRPRKLQFFSRPMIEPLISQYRAGLAMLRSAIDAYPDDLWIDTRFTNPAWRVAHHVLFYTHLYLSPSEAEFTPWEHSISGANFMDEPLPDGATPTMRASLIEY